VQGCAGGASLPAASETKLGKEANLPVSLANFDLIVFSGIPTVWHENRPLAKKGERFGQKDAGKSIDIATCLWLLYTRIITYKMAARENEEKSQKKELTNNNLVYRHKIFKDNML
jgi:hypothetical protein